MFWTILDLTFCGLPTKMQHCYSLGPFLIRPPGHVRKVHVRDNSCLEILRFSFSSLHGGFFKPKLLREIPDPVTGFPLRWEDHSDGVVDQSSSQSYQAKRVAARRAGSSYAYDLPGMLQLALRMKWISAPEESRAKGSQATGTRRRSPSPRGRTVPSKVENMPKDVLKAKELVMESR